MRGHSSKGNVLVFTDDDSSAVRLEQWIRAAGLPPVLLGGSESFLMAEGDDETVDLVVTDLDTGEPAAVRLLEKLARGELFPDVPQIHVLRDTGFRGRLEAWSAQAAALAISGPVDSDEFRARLGLAAEVGRLRRECAQGATRDPLTGLYARRCFLYRLDDEFHRARRYRVALSLAVFDIDGLRKINARFGETVGDHVIVGLAEILGSCGRRSDLAGRIGEDSFGLMLPQTRFRGAALIANRIRAQFETVGIEAGDRPVETRLSGGIAAFPENSAMSGAGDLLDRAEGAMARAKARDGNRVYIDEGAIRGGHTLVLVLDADPDLPALVEELLGEDGYQVVRASSLESALEAVRFRAPDLLILDLDIGAEDDGPAPVERIRQASSSAGFPVVGMCRNAPGDPAELQRLGIDRFVTKPFSVSVLRSLTREILDG